MYATIKPCVGTDNLFYYNEKKLRNREADCIYAGNFLKEAAELTLQEKKQHFKDLMALNQRAINKGISLVLEFYPAKRLANEELIDITFDFMQRIDYGSQPFLIYLHEDTAYQHLHVLTTNIRYDGSRIPDHLVGARVINPTRKAIMAEYGLDIFQKIVLKEHNPQEKIQYGKTLTRQAMADSLKYILDTYTYRSLSEFNAILRLYNLKATNGSPDSWLRRNRGLLYQITDDNGKVRNAPIKSSDFPFKPTLDNLEKRFAANQRIALDAGWPRLAVDRAIDDRPATAETFKELLRRDHIAPVPFHDKQGAVIELFFVDLASKTVLSPADLGSRYEAPVISQRLGFDPFPKPGTKKTVEQENKIDAAQRERQEQKTHRSRGHHR
jgi:Relaxase/Mobilisation nuclease domain